MTGRGWLVSLLLTAACAAPMSNPTTTFIVVRLDHTPTSADSLAAIRLGTDSVGVIPVARALAITTSSSTAAFARLSGEVTLFTSQSAASLQFVDIELAASPSSSDRALVASLSATQVSDIGATGLLADIPFNQLNELSADSNVQSVTFEMNYHFGVLVK
ncbi:MAG TPA: hypothetical protein VGM20_08885 [Gemmatimonadales bacterium]|jgi:hypothetical protein